MALNVLYATVMGILNSISEMETKEWCPWVPNPEYPGTKEWIIDFDGTPIDPPIVWRHQKLIAQGIHELDSLLEWANHYFKP
jgi:hypothetical protein